MVTRPVPSITHWVQLCKDIKICSILSEVISTYQVKVGGYLTRMLLVLSWIFLTLS